MIWYMIASHGIEYNSAQCDFARRLFERCASGQRYRPLADLFQDLNPGLFDDWQMRLLRDLVFSAAAGSLCHKPGEEKEERREEGEQAWYYFMAITDVDLKVNCMVVILL
jgi:hypothetical protein